MTTLAIQLDNVCKQFPFFALQDICLRLEEGQIMGFVGPNGAGKSTTIRILMGLLRQASGEVKVLGLPMPQQQTLAKQQIGYVTDDMALFGNASLAWHIELVRSIYPDWDDAYAKTLLDRFYLNPQQMIKGLSHGERIKALLLLVLARRPRLLILDEPTSGLDPVARHEVLAELMDVLRDDDRSILFSSHNTVDVEQISDCITFIDRGRIIQSSDKESFLEGWRRLKLDVPDGAGLPHFEEAIEVSTAGKIATVTTNAYTPGLQTRYAQAGITVHEVQRMTLEEVFVANVMYSRKERS
ncbi:MAG: ABC transporter ATP-binding protein [Pseudohongiellaceae bacterium]